jgi:hypothetical protein
MPLAEKDYYSFDEVLSDLHMEADQLKRLVSAGEIRAFRDQDTMRFKATDVQRLKQAQTGAGELDLDLGDELDLTDDVDLETQAGSQGDELVLEDETPAGANVEEVDLAAVGDAGGGDVTRRRPSRAAAAAAAVPEQSEGALMLFMLIFGFAVLAFANFAAFGAVAGRTNGLNAFLAQIFA